MRDAPLIRTDGADDPVHHKLKAAVEKRQSAYLWTPADTIRFTPRLLPIFYGDGRALFRITTINQRPAYWVIRACSTWGCGLDGHDASGPDFGEITDDIMTDLEDAFGRGRCGYSGSSLFHPRKERIQWCQCEECSDRHVARWPEVDDNGGCSWSRMDWPSGFATVKNPLSWQGNLLPEALAARAALQKEEEGR
ncbi:hypothetical protein [Methylobacterium aquaticum]|uniref:hypothetical protein n=1 Tax=Methylobacterium aquaticum TaxID=270351 RepID=UPI001933D286|nr:hypothetical protein [Methylobacterium aquaticum]QRE76512.1 hypothetical protein F1D61_25685 [Methylobacterium aquaticum]